tara:strand:- start:758 stop:919 length:162 start_codon:yes stop_codon:yes gene_type:complete
MIFFSIFFSRKCQRNVVVECQCAERKEVLNGAVYKANKRKLRRVELSKIFNYF